MGSFLGSPIDKILPRLYLFKGSEDPSEDPLFDGGVQKNQKFKPTRILDGLEDGGRGYCFLLYSISVPQRTVV
jgi:hypothetical protein